MAKTRPVPFSLLAMLDWFPLESIQNFTFIYAVTVNHMSRGLLEYENPRFRGVPESAEDYN